MLIGLDVDGVCADWITAVLNELGRTLPLDGVTLYHVQALLSPEDRIRMRKLLRDPQFWTILPLIPGAVEGVAKLLAQDHELVFITTPWWGCREWLHARKLWLEGALRVVQPTIIATDRKYLVAVDLLIDDKAEHIEQFHQRRCSVGAGGWRIRGPRAVIFDQPWNRAALLPWRMMGWSDLDRILEEMR